MRRSFLARTRLVFLATCVICLFTVALSSASEGPQAKRVSDIRDWTTRHVIYTGLGTTDRMQAGERDPRAAFARLRFTKIERDERPGRHKHAFRGLRRDWSINLGSAGTAPNMSPAKFTFDVTAAPSCSNDYVIYPVNATGSTTQPNIVAFNNLYSGTGAGGAGSCNRTSPPTDDDGTDATVLWSYDVDAIGGAVTTSPVISWDVAGASPTVLGTKVAFVESAPGSPAHFHVLAWHDGDGQDTTDTAGLQNTLQPATISTFTVTEPVAGSGTATDLALGTAGTDTLSSPFVDYAHDVAYVGNDLGTLYRIKDVFCPSYNNDAGCTIGAAPSLDASWGTGGAVTVGAGGCGVLTSPVEDFTTGNVFVGCSDGRLYGFNSSGTPLSTHFVPIGDGFSPASGIVDAPIVDSSNGLVYAVSGNDGTHALLVQTTTTLSVKRAAALGPAVGGLNLHLPAFNDAYFSEPTTPGDWAILSCGFDITGAFTTLYDVGFTGSHVMNTGTPALANQFTLSSQAEECSPLTEFTNVPGPPGAPTDWLFLGLRSSQVINSYDITAVTGSAGFPGTFGLSATDVVSGGSSGIIVDNESATGQASSIYFSTLGSTISCGAGGSGYCAVKLTQSGLK